MSVKKLYSYEAIKGTSIHEAEHYRISDPEDNRIGTCYLPENAKRIVDALNESLNSQQTNLGARQITNETITLDDVKDGDA